MEETKNHALTNLSSFLDVDNPVELRRQLAETEGLVATVSVQKRLALQNLTVARGRALPTKTRDLTELDRKIQLEALTAQQEKEASDWGDLEKKLYNRISLGQSLLSSITEEMRRL